MSAVTFDFGQTLAELDSEMLARRAGERGAEVSVGRVVAETPGAWLAYNEAKKRGLVAHDAWCTFMRTLLERAGLHRLGEPDPERGDPRLADELAEWFWGEQPAKNLWRKSIAGMYELAAELAAEGVILGVVSNSEGKVSELMTELGIRQHFRVVADSGVLCIEKPDPRIFEWAAERMGVAARDLIHVGDAFEADVMGALRAGARAIWFQPADARELPNGVTTAHDAPSVRAALRRFGVGKRVLSPSRAR